MEARASSSVLEKAALVSHVNYEACAVVLQVLRLLIRSG